MHTHIYIYIYTYMYDMHIQICAAYVTIRPHHPFIRREAHFVSPVTQSPPALSFCQQQTPAVLIRILSASPRERDREREKEPSRCRSIWVAAGRLRGGCQKEHRAKVGPNEAPSARGTCSEVPTYIYIYIYIYI